MKPIILHGIALLGLQQIDAFHVATTRLRRGTGPPSTLRSTRYLNEYGEPVSDLQSTLSSIDGVPDILYHNNNNNKTGFEVDDDDEGTSVMSSVTHWSDIMRQDSWLQQQQQQQTHQKLENSSSQSTMRATTGANDSDVSSRSSNGDAAWPNDLSTLSKEDLGWIEEYWDRLMPTVSYLGTTHVAQIYKALQVAYRAHRGQMRKSGEPFIIHVRESKMLSLLLLLDVVVSSSSAS